MYCVNFVVIIYILLFTNFILLLIINIIWQLPQMLRVGSGVGCLGLNCFVLAQLLNLAAFSLLIFGLERKAESSQNRCK